jgi:hypothetical protein
MANTRFNYDYQRTAKLLQESTGPGRYFLNTPGPGVRMPFVADPFVRLQQWGANLRSVPGGAVIDMASDLDGRTRRLTNDCVWATYPRSGVVRSVANSYPVSTGFMTEQSRATHPAWMYVDREQTRWEYPILNPQENVCMPIETDIDTRLQARDAFIPQMPCPLSFFNRS